MDEEHPILLIAAPWKDRAYLLAELQERGYEVRSFPGIVTAIGYLIRRPRVQPVLVVLDVVDDPDISTRTLEDLFAMTESVPWLVIASRLHPLPDTSVLHAPRVQVMYRPVRVGTVVEQVEQLLRQYRKDNETRADMHTRAHPEEKGSSNP